MISTITVDDSTLDGIVNEIQMESVDYLILTVNMEEANILRGAEEILQQNLDIVLIASSELASIEEKLTEYKFDYTVDETFAPVVYASKRSLTK